MLKEKLQQRINEGRVQMAQVLSDIQAEFDHRKDFMIPKERMQYAVNKDITLLIDNNQFNLTDHSRQQLLNRVGIPSTFYDKLKGFNLQPLIKQNLDELTSKLNTSIMLRTVDTNVKGFLTPSYKRMDASPIFSAFIQSSLNAGYEPFRGYNTDYRYQLRMIQPDLFSPNGNDEAITFGMAFTTGDYGGQALKLEIFILRLICLNGMLGFDTFKKVHIGKRFDNTNNLFSAQTINLDEQAMISGIHDVVKALPAKIENLKSDIIQSTQIEPKESLFDKLKKRMQKSEFDEMQNLYNNVNDITILPEKKSNWRLANAISFIAKSKKPDRAIDLEGLASEVI